MDVSQLALLSGEHIANRVQSDSERLYRSALCIVRSLGRCLRRFFQVYYEGTVCLRSQLEGHARFW